VPEDKNHLSLNWVDGAAYLYNWSGPATFIKIMDFIDKWIPNRKVIVHCDQGYSRSPTVCMLYLAKRKNLIPCDSYNSAYKEFMKIFPEYSPGGIGEYVHMNWSKIL
jgi:protein-tyrosine phosphatase